MSLEAETKKKKVMWGLSNQKLDALKDVLLNRKIVRIQPVNVELRQQYLTLRSNYEKSLKERLLRDQPRTEYVAPKG